MKRTSLVLGLVLIAGGCASEPVEPGSSTYESSSSACAGEASTCAGECVDALHAQDLAAQAMACATAVQDCVEAAGHDRDALAACRDLTACHPDFMQTATASLRECLGACGDSFDGCVPDDPAAEPPEDPSSGRGACVDTATSCLGGCADAVAACEPPACNPGALADCLGDPATARTCIRDAVAGCASEVDLSCLEASRGCFGDCAGALRDCFDAL